MQKQSTLHNLFLIIQAMMREEKRYFKLYLKGLGKIEGHQSKLFDFLSKQEEFNETEIKEKLKVIFPSQNRSALQINTYQNIIKSLNLFHANTYAETKILDLLKTIKLLYVKNLYTLAVPEIEKAKKLAIEHKYVALLPQILFWEFKVKGQGFSFNYTSEEVLQEKFEEFEQALQELQNVYVYTKSWTEFYIYVRHHFSNKGDKNTNTNPPCIQNLPAPIHLHSVLLNSKTQSLQAYISDSHSKGFKALLVAIEEMEKSPLIIKEYFYDYINLIYRATGGLIARKEWVLSKEYLNKFHELPKSMWNPAVNATYLELCFHYNLRSGDLKANQETCVLAKKLLKEHQHQLKMITVRDLMIALAVSAFYEANYDECIDYLTYLESLKYEDINMKNVIKIVLMLAYYEKGENILLPYVIRSNYRFFKKEEPRRAFGHVITKTLNKASKTISKEKAVQFFRELKEELTAEHHSYYNGTLLFFDVRIWLYTKINNVDMQTALNYHRDIDLIH